MKLSPLGAQAATYSPVEKQTLANNLIAGLVDIVSYVPFGVCYDAVAYVRYLLNAPITADELLTLRGQDWIHKFNFTSGAKWNGVSPIPKGTAVGFYRIVDLTVFHGAIALGGGSSIRATNGGNLGIGWQQVNLQSVLGSPDKTDGTFIYDNTKIVVYLSGL